MFFQLKKLIGELIENYKEIKLPKSVTQDHNKLDYQTIKITESAIDITFPDGNNIKAPTQLVLEALIKAFKGEFIKCD